MIVEKAVWMIERNADQPLTLNGVAEACGVSRSHLANAFGSATGTPLIKYLRGRRLSEAARALAEGAPDILSAGYGSHEAFTRAFRDQFGLTPEAAREIGGLDAQALVAPLEFRPTAFPRLSPPRLERADAVRAVGLAQSVSFDALVEIPAQWRRFMSRHDEITAPLDSIPIGVCHPADEDGVFTYVAAAEVARFGTLPKGFSGVDIEPRLCAVFEHPGHVSTIFETYTAIWNEALPATGQGLAEGPVIERHNPSFDPETGEGGLTLWIPVTQP
jgi:AraC family transcriptional regulator